MTQTPVPHPHQWQQHMHNFNVSPVNLMAHHMRTVHEWTIFQSEEDDPSTLRAMHRCAHQNEEVTR